MGPKRALRQFVELPGLDICFELLVPSDGVKLREPLSKPDQLFWRELLDLPFNNFYWTHKKSSIGSGTVYLRLSSS